MQHVRPVCTPAQLPRYLLECCALVAVQDARQPHSPKSWVALLCVVLCHAAAQHALEHLQDELYGVQQQAAGCS
jgi:hypothetical protein